MDAYSMKRNHSRKIFFDATIEKNCSNFLETIHKCLLTAAIGTLWSAMMTKKIKQHGDDVRWSSEY